MAHWAKIVDGVVVEVLVAEKEFIDSYDPEGTWLQTSYNTRGGIHYQPNSNEPSEDQSKALRKNFAGVGYTYDPNLDAFMMPKPYPSWVLNTESCLWEAPIPRPVSDDYYVWDEDQNAWVLA
jgi:hypothetical protein